jgi:hypothetical protein
MNVNIKRLWKGLITHLKTKHLALSTYLINWKDRE